jgi:hypothetical protein
MLRTTILLVSVTAAPASAPSTTQTTPATATAAQLQDPQFWLDRAKAEWAEITDAHNKPWKEMAECQVVLGDDLGLKRTLAELNGSNPAPQAKDYAHINDRIVQAYSDLAGAFARVGDEEGLRRAITIATDKTRAGQVVDTMRERVARSLARAGRDDDAIAMANTISRVDNRLDALLFVATTAGQAGRKAASDKAFMLARRLTAPVDQASAKTSAAGRQQLSRALMAVGQLDEVGRLAKSLPDEARAQVEAQLAVRSRERSDEARRHAQFAVDALRKAGWSGYNGNVPNVTEDIVLAGAKEPLASLLKLINEAKAAPMEQYDRDAPVPAGFVNISRGQSFAIGCHAGLARGFARARNADAAREHLRLAEEIVRSADAGPLAINWYKQVHLPVVAALIDADLPLDAIALVKTVPQGPTRGENPQTVDFLARDVKRQLAIAYFKAGDVPAGMAAWQGRDTPTSLLTDHAIKTSTLGALLEGSAGDTRPARCARYLHVAKRLSGSAGAGPATTQSVRRNGR